MQNNAMLYSDFDPNLPKDKPKGLMRAIHLAFAENIARVHLDVRSLHHKGELQLWVRLKAIRNNAIDLVGDAITEEPRILNADPLHEKGGHLIIPITPEMLDDADFCDEIRQFDEILYRPDALHP